jgi:chemotaxis protein methyltransferase WspC
MTSESFKQIIHYVETKLGLKSESVRNEIWEEILKKRMAFSGLDDYHHYLKLLRRSMDEYHKLIEWVVVPETWFFREKAIFDFLKIWVKQHSKLHSQIKILSLACSSGEEPYSIAMALLDARVSKSLFKIDAFDISHDALLKAEKGLYLKNSFRVKELSFRDHHFSKTSSGYLIDDKVKEKVNFYYANLLDKGVLFPSLSYHVIFCRNLLIYLNKKGQKEIFKKIKALLNPGGILIVGPAETHLAFNEGFHPIPSPSTYAFMLKAE